PQRESAARYRTAMPQQSPANAPGGDNTAAAPAMGSRLLVVMPSWVGDCIMAIPLLRALCRHYRDAGREIIISAYLRPHLAPLFRSGDLVDVCIEGRPRGLLGPAREARRLRAGGFDTALLLPNSFRAALTTRLARIPRRIGYDRDHRGWLLSDRVPCPVPGGWRQPMAQIDYYLGLAASFDISPPDDRSPRLATSVAELDRARRLIRAAGIDDAAPVALLNPGASKAEKRWPPERFGRLADRLHDHYGMQIILNGSPAERALTGRIAALIQRAAVVDLAQHEIDLATLAAVCALADLVVTNDTGTRHIAAAVGFEHLAAGGRGPALVTIFGTVPPQWTTLHYPAECELFDEATGRVDAISLEQVAEACDASIIAGQRSGARPSTK
ncbi:MAG TPA: lipopolysaccharide heptosyltransferase II, partial [Arenicellales bacterium]|nr:lipopolysaccharide heptosyltransferase II [Arenicellales bacterium]